VQEKLYVEITRCMLTACAVALSFDNRRTRAVICVFVCCVYVCVCFVDVLFLDTSF